jgi:transcriptional regulator with XRE-family HTH domain
MEDPREPFYVRLREEIGTRVRDRRIELGLSQRQLAELERVREGQIGTWERGQVPWQRINSLARHLDVSPEWIAHGVRTTEEQVAELIERVAALDEKVTSGVGLVARALEVLDAQQQSGAGRVQGSSR